MRIAVVTIVSGRHRHLRGQLRGLATSTLSPWLHVIVAIGDDGITDVVSDTLTTAAQRNVQVVDVPASNGRLPVGQARNLGARTALDAGADLLVFLDVDCIPGPDLLLLYRDTAVQETYASALMCGPVTYLPARADDWTVAELTECTAPHPARPDPPAGLTRSGTDYDLFWSLSFAVTAQTWERIGGFHDGYLGYGGEDTDFASLARTSNVGLCWVGGAHAYHQHHPISSPPVEHLDDIVRNSALFHRRWGRWPMVGWLDQFERDGLIARTADGGIRRTVVNEE